MKLVLTYKSLPEFRNTPPEARDLVWNRCLKRVPQRWLDFLIFWFSVLAVSIFMNVTVLGWYLGIAREPLPGFSFLVPFLAAEGIWRLVLLRRARRFIAEEMPGHCRTCGYSLVGIPTKRCPECGAAAAPAAKSAGPGNHLTAFAEIS